MRGGSPSLLDVWCFCAVRRRLGRTGCFPPARTRILHFEISHELVEDVLAVAGAELLDYESAAIIALGLAIGAAAMLSELPNSMLKRQLGIAPGAAASGFFSAVFYVLDQVDMLFGIWLVLALVIEVTATRVLWSVVFLFITHQILTVVGYQLGMRATVR